MCWLLLRILEAVGFWEIFCLPILFHFYWSSGWTQKWEKIKLLKTFCYRILMIYMEKCILTIFSLFQYLAIKAGEKNLVYSKAHLGQGWVFETHSDGLKQGLSGSFLIEKHNLEASRPELVLVADDNLGKGSETEVGGRSLQRGCHRRLLVVGEYPTNIWEYPEKYSRVPCKISNFPKVPCKILSPPTHHHHHPHTPQSVSPTHLHLGNKKSSGDLVANRYLVPFSVILVMTMCVTPR